MRKHAFASLLLGIVISTLGMWYALRDVDIPAMVRGIGHVEISWLIGSVVAGLLSLVVRALRWRLLLDQVKQVEVGALVSATFIGIMANNLLPARLGEVVRAWALARRKQMPMPTVLGSIFVERLLDVITILALLGLCLFLSPDLGSRAARVLKYTGLIVLLFVAAGTGGLLVTVHFRNRLLQAGECWAMRDGRAWTSRLVELLHRFLDGLCTFRGGMQTVVVTVLSVLVWAMSVASFQILAEGFGLGLTPVQVTLVFVIVLLGIAVPSAPGYVGTFHGFCVAGLAMVAGTEPALALAYATLLHGSQWLAINVIGLGCLLADRSVTWANMVSFMRQAR